MPRIKIDKFLEVLEQSNLLPRDLISKVAQRVADSKTEVDPRSVAKWLVEKNYITLWQARQLLAGRTTFFLGRYKLLDRIGKGGMGVVFRAQHAVMDRTVALKVMARHLLNKPRAVERFNREVKTAAALHHPNIITAFDADRVGNTHFLVMEFVDGVDLNSWLRSRGPLPVSAACECGMQVAEGLAHATAMGMVHRDIKPVNLLVSWNETSSSPVVKLLDMGLARFVSETQEDGGLTRVGQTIGTPDYIAPEAAENFKDADIRADIFSLGCTMFRLLTARLPYTGENTMEKLLARATRDAPPVSSLRPEVPAEIEAVVAKMLARDPAERYQTPREVAEALAPFAASRIGDTESLQYFRHPPDAQEKLSAASFEADADTSLEDFFRDFSASPLREDSSSPDVAARSTGDELALANDDDSGGTTVAARSKSGSSGDLTEAVGARDNLLLDDEPSLKSPHEAHLLDDPLATVRGDKVDTRRSKSRSSASAARAPKLKAANQNVWDTKLILVGGGALLALVMVGVALLVVIGRETGDQAYQLAEEDYRAGSYTQAIHRYDQYLEKFPNHPQAGLARVHRGLARLRQAVEGSSDWERALETAERVTREISPEAEFGEARGDLASLLPRIAVGLSQQARQRKEPELVERTRDAVGLVQKFVPRPMQPEVELAEIDASLALTQREMDRDAALNQAIEDIAASVAAAEPARAYEVRKQLLKTYPDLDRNESLLEAILSVTDAQRAAVHAQSERVAAETEPPSTNLLGSASLAQRAGQDAPDVAGHVLFALVEGAAYGLNATTGEVLWRHFVGFDTRVVPQPIGTAPGADAILVNSTRDEVWRVGGSTGELLWRQPIDDAFDAAPVLLRSEMLLATRAGQLLSIDLTTGELGRTIEVPDALSVAPAVDASERHIYQLADHSTLYVLNAASGSCEEVVYLGHEAGNIKVPPLLVSRYVLVADNYRFEKSRLRVFVTDEAGLNLRQVQSLDLDGHVYVKPLVQNRSLSLVTDRGAVYTFEIAAPDQPTPLTVVATSPVEDRPPVVRYPLVASGQLFIADDRLRKYDVQAASGRLAPKWVNDQGDLFLQPLEAKGDVLFHVRRKATSPGGAVSAIRTSDGGRIWETQLAAPLAGEPALVGGGEQLVALSRVGGLYPLAAGAWSGSSIENEPAQKINLPVALPEAAHLVPLDDRLTAIASGPGQERILTFDAADLSQRVRSLSLPDRLACGPLPLSGALLAPGRVGQVFLLDPATGRNRVEPFQPVLGSNEQFAWSGTTLRGGEEALLTDGRARLYRLGISESPEPNLAALAEVQLEQPISTPLAALDHRVFAADRRGRLLMFDLPSLDPAGNTQLEGQVAWGPHVAQAQVVLATDNQRMHCYGGDGSLVWQVSLPYGPVTGRPLVAGDHLLVSSGQGLILKFSLATGELLGEIDVEQPLASGPVLLGDEVIAAGHDGTVVRVPQP